MSIPQRMAADAYLWAAEHLEADSPNFDYALTFSFSAIGGIISKWYQDGKKLSLEELLYNCYWLVSSGVFGFAQMKPFSEA